MLKFKNITKILSGLLILSSLASCTTSSGQDQDKNIKTNKNLIHYNQNTLSTRFSPPEGYNRKKIKGFGHFLRSLKLLPKGSQVSYYDGSVKDSTGVYCAVVDQEIQKRDLHQCADAIMRQYATYLFQNKKYDQISFTFQSGFSFPFSKWAQGYRVDVSNGGKWYKKTNPSYSKNTFDQYLTMVYAYCGTASLDKDLKDVSLEDMKIGDILIQGGHPGHAVLVVDVAENKDGNKMFLLAQSYMPAQQMQILINPKDPNISPWYDLSTIDNSIKTPEWEFNKNNLKRF